MREERTDRHVYRKAGIRWAMLTPIEQYQPCNNSDQHLYQQEKEGLGKSWCEVSVESSLGPQSSRRGKLQRLAFAHTGHIFCNSLRPEEGFAMTLGASPGGKLCMGLMHWSLSITHVNSGLVLLLPFTQDHTFPHTSTLTSHPSLVSSSLLLEHILRWLLKKGHTGRKFVILCVHFLLLPYSTLHAQQPKGHPFAVLQIEYFSPPAFFFWDSICWLEVSRDFNLQRLFLSLLLTLPHFQG